ncbi:MAG TPA: NUDIX domain-containing protein [Candidatus Saccharimonadales bacterium]|jgi:8-oxo-dGTP diphosphatase|nr:NUDIX domain-containing protein [Candidatus Saccharimonadales bacterium]
MPKESTEPIYIGCELIVRKDDQILLGLRKNHFGAGTWGLPGGHLEFSERLVDTACREAKEEIGLDIQPSDLHLISVVDGVPTSSGQQHHVHVTFELREPAQEPRNTEPEFCEELRYFPLDALPENILPTHQPIIENYVANRLYKYISNN